MVMTVGKTNVKNNIVKGKRFRGALTALVNEKKFSTQCARILDDRVLIPTLGHGCETSFHLYRHVENCQQR